MTWNRIKKPTECAGCSKSDWCLVNDDNSQFLCMRVESSKSITLKDGSIGWIHNVGEQQRQRPVIKKYKPNPKINAEAMMSKWQRATKPEWISRLAVELGVKASSLIELRVAWANEHNAWAWPMRNGKGRLVGIRLRDNSGRKWSVIGSQNALFMPYFKPQNMLWIVEGGTSCAAALSMNLFAIGRPSCSGGVFDVIETIRRLSIRRAVIVSDNDVERHRPDGSHYCAGIDGGISLSQRLPIPCCVVTLPYKDLREAYKLGFTADDIEQLTNNFQWIMPKGKI